MLDKKIILNDDSLFVEKNDGIINYFQNNKEFTIEEVIYNFQKASIDLKTYANRFHDQVHLEREETKILFDWIKTDLKEESSKVSLLVGDAGMGKSVILKDLIDLLQENEIPVLGIKVDKILNAYSLREIEGELNLKDGILSFFENLCKNDLKCVLLIDQIDALSQSLSSKRNALTTYDRLIKQLNGFSNVRIVLSTRTFDLNHDPIIKEYKINSSLVNVSLLSIEQVKDVLHSFEILVVDDNLQLLEFLRVPLHLNLFCTIGGIQNFKKDISLQTLYDNIWNRFIINDSLQYDIDHNRIAEALQFIADSMNKRQQIVIDKRHLDLYAKEVNYLLHQNLIVSNENKIQFIHQTFFDYTYARTFFINQKEISQWIIGQHQGLFIRSQVRQVFTYLRNLDPEKYIHELRAFLNEENYRFHLKILLINDLASFQFPTYLEKNLVKKVILPNTSYIEIFINSVQDIQWFDFLKDSIEFKGLMLSSDKKKNRIAINLCSKMINKDAGYVIEFLEQNINSINLIESVLTNIDINDVHLGFKLYKETNHLWSEYFRSEYIFLEKAIIKHPLFVVEELKKDLINYLESNLFDSSKDSYMPNDYSVMEIYKKLYEIHPTKAIHFFIYSLLLVMEKYTFLSESNDLQNDPLFLFFDPDDPQDYLHQKIFFWVKSYIKKIESDDIEYIYLSLLESKKASIMSIGVCFLIEYKDKYLKHIYLLFTRNDYFNIYYNNKLLRYYTHELLRSSFNLLSGDEQKKVLEAILKTEKKYFFWTWENFYSKKKVYSNFLELTHTLLNFVPIKIIEENLLVQRKYKEGMRRYGEVTNIKPRGVHLAFSGYQTYEIKTYEKMTLEDLKKSFYTINGFNYDLGDKRKPELEGHKEKFAELVHANPDKYNSFIKELVLDKNINISYIFSAIEALQKKQYSFSYINEVIKNVISYRFTQSIELEQGHTLMDFLRIIEHFIHSNSTMELDVEIFNFIDTVVLQYPDAKTVIKSVNQEFNKPNDIVISGINSVRGVAVSCLISCYNISDYKNRIFESLSIVADQANEITRSCIIYQGACLTSVDMEKTYSLYLKTVSDFHPLLLAIPFSREHPLLYLMKYNFLGLRQIFERGIETEIVGEVMSNFLLHAFMFNERGSYKLLLKLLNHNEKARKNVIHIVAKECLFKSDFSKKGWRLIHYLMKFNSASNGESFSSLFLKMEVTYSNEVIYFINRYLESPLAKYKNEYFYKYIQSLIPFDSVQCLQWFLLSDPNLTIGRYRNNISLNVLIESYYGVREYDKSNTSLEQAMDMFDTLLKIPEYRNIELSSFLKELES